MPARRKPTLLAQGKPRTLGGSTRPWRVRLYARGAGTKKYQVFFRAPTGEGEPWKRVLRQKTCSVAALNQRVGRPAVPHLTRPGCLSWLTCDPSSGGAPAARP